MAGKRIGVVCLGGKTTYKTKHPEVVDIDDLYDDESTKHGMSTSAYKKAWRERPDWWHEVGYPAIEARVDAELASGKTVLVHAQDPKVDFLVVPEGKEYMRRAMREAHRLNLTPEQMSIVHRLASSVVQLSTAFGRTRFGKVALRRTIEDAMRDKS
jgi:mitochondrial fission protein ELM1